MSKVVIILCIFFLGCVQRTSTVSLLGTTLEFPISSVEAKKRFQLNLVAQGRYFSIDHKTCKTMSVCFADDDSVVSSRSKVWGINISLDSTQMTLSKVISIIERENNVLFKLDTSERYNPYYKASKGGIKYAVRLTGGGAIPNLAHLPSSAQHCFSKHGQGRVTIYVTDQLDDRAFYYYIASDGTIVDSD